MWREVVNAEMSLLFPNKMTLEELDLQEKKIYKNVLKTTDSVRYSLTTYEQKQAEFKSTCEAIHTIIDRKLFRIHYVSVENYFRKRWEVSRAQAYRLMDCHPVLEVSYRLTRDFEYF